MLYRFKSKNRADLVMLEPHGRRVLEIIGKDAGPLGIILPEQMPQALVALREAVEQEAREVAEARAAFELAHGREPGPREEHGPRDGVQLRQRVHPFVQLLEFCQQQGDTVVWGV